MTKGVEELILRSGSAVAYGFREESSGGSLSVKPLWFTLPLVISDDFAEALDEIARKLGDQEYSPVYTTAEGFQIYVRVIMSRGGVVFSNVYDETGKTVRPEAKTGSVMNVKAAVKVDSVFFGKTPKIQPSLIEARVEDTEMVREKLL